MNTRVPNLAVAALAAAGLCTGCIMPDQFAQMQRDVADVRRQMQQIESEQVAARARLQELAQAAEGSNVENDRVTTNDLSDLGFRVDQATREAAATDERLRDLSQRFERLTQEIERRANDLGSVRPIPPQNDSRPSGTARNPDAPTGAPAGDTAYAAEELYNTAYADFSKGNYDLAIAGFLEFHDTYPTSSQADNALYWVGECNFSQGEFSRAIQAFDRLLERFPDSDKAASGDLKKGLAYLEQNQVGKAIVQFQHVHDRYGGTDEARVARDRLSALGVSI